MFLFKKLIILFNIKFLIFVTFFSDAWKKFLQNFYTALYVYQVWENLDTDVICTYTGKTNSKCPTVGKLVHRVKQSCFRFCLRNESIVLNMLAKSCSKVLTMAEITTNLKTVREKISQAVTKRSSVSIKLYLKCNAKKSFAVGFW